jgi:CheY-like chemotaxis protein
MPVKPSSARVLVASDNAADAEQVVGQLGDVMENVRSATDPARAVADFESFKPHVLVLAFGSIEMAQRYSLGYRHSEIIKLHRHATVLLCAKDDVSQAFTLCRKGTFDDYALHWPMAQDGYRLPMSVWKAADQLMSQSSGPSRHDLSAHANALDALDRTLETSLVEGGELAQRTAGSLTRAEHAVGSAIDEFSRRLSTPESADAALPHENPRLAAEIVRLKRGGIAQAFKAAKPSWHRSRHGQDGCRPASSLMRPACARSRSRCARPAGWFSWSTMTSSPASSWPSRCPNRATNSNSPRTGPPPWRCCAGSAHI